MEKALAAATALLVMAAGCGGEPTSPTGTLPQVTGLVVVESLCTGTDVALSWNAPDVVVDGYRIYWSPLTGTWDELANVADTFYVDDVAARDGGSGYYTILAFKGVNTSEDYSEYVDTHPNWIGTYTIWSNHAPADSMDAAIFGETAAILGRASDSSFVQDVYCYDGGWPQSPVGLYSGDHEPWGDGSHTAMAKGNNPFIAPDTGYTSEIHLIENDRLFMELSGGCYAKLIVSSIPVDTLEADIIVYGIEFNCWYQPIEGLRVFDGF